MTQTEIEEFLNADRHAILATTGEDGLPQVTPVWFLHEAGRIYLSAQTSTVKVRNVRRNPSIGICIDGNRDDTRYVSASGRAELVEAEEPLQEEMRRRIIGKYYDSEDEAQQYYDSVRDNPAVLIVLQPERIFGMDLN